MQRDGWLQDEGYFLNGERQRESMKLIIGGTVILVVHPWSELCTSSLSAIPRIRGNGSLTGRNLELVGANRLLYDHLFTPDGSQ